jgi:cysteinyl-tRNA synthetase
MRVFNTLSGQKEEFIPQGDPIKMYVCGVTPYDDCHIGHAMSYVVFDTIRRYLKFRGYKVKYVQNFTDIDDKIINRAHQIGVSPQELVDKFIAQYFVDMDALNIERADIYPRATEEIPEIIEIIQGIMEKGQAYPSDGDVYFRVKSAPDYGKLTHRNLEEIEAGSQTEEKGGKEHPMDFALWKGAKPGEPSWVSPWGPGRPGWHIECSAMALRYLGETLDIHGGGKDLVFPHHENETAQSESFTGVIPFARYWVHHGLVQLGEEKMSKSLGNLITVGEAREGFSADAIRLFILSSHYRSPLTYIAEGVEAAERGVERLRQAVRPQPQRKGAPVDPHPYRRRFIEAMDDDFNTAQALAVLFDLARETNRGKEEGHDVSPGRETLLELSGVLGMTLKEEHPSLPAEPFINLQKLEIAKIRKAKLDGLIDRVEASLTEDDRGVQSVESFINYLIQLREQLRKDKHFQLADEVRTKLGELAIALEDTPQGTVWKYKPGRQE